MPKVRSIFLSDIHLGTRACQAERLLEFLREHIHIGADGKRYLLTHGDDFDQVTKCHRWAAVLGDHAYALAVRLNGLLSRVRRRLGISGYWSLAGYAKRKVKGAVSFIFDFEESVVRYVKKLKVDGVICGHMHVAAIKEIDGITYINCGDWVDSCTAILEHHDGQMELIEWAGQPRRAQAEAAHHGRPSSEPSPVTGPAWTPPLARRGQAAKDVTAIMLSAT